MKTIASAEGESFMPEENGVLTSGETDEIILGLADQMVRSGFDPEFTNRLRLRVGKVAAGNRSRRAALAYGDYETHESLPGLKRFALIDKAKALVAQDDPNFRHADSYGYRTTANWDKGK